jgi:hypothetical protein
MANYQQSTFVGPVFDAAALSGAGDTLLSDPMGTPVEMVATSVAADAPPAVWVSTVLLATAVVTLMTLCK